MAQREERSWTQDGWRLRLARPADEAALFALIERSVRGLQADDYSAAQLDVAIGTVFGVDLALIGDGTYFLVETADRIIGSGGWSRRATLFGVHQAVRDERLLVPGVDPARIRAFFVDPAWARRGIASAILTACERAARQEGFTQVSLAATLTGIPFYRRAGFRDVKPFETPLADGQSMALLAMEKSL